MEVHHRVWEQKPARPWQPLATYWLLGIMGGIFALELLLSGTRWLGFLFVVDTDWYLRPWSPFTSTLSHGGFEHILFNGLMMFFFGPVLERLLGRRDFVALFMLSGAVSGIIQVELSAAFGEGGGALGASGALMFLFGTLVVLMPKEKVLIWGILPLPFWVAGIAYAALDIMGAFNPGDGIGNFAHLAGMLIGLAFGFGTRHNPKTRFGRPKQRVYFG